MVQFRQASPSRCIMQPRFARTPMFTIQLFWSLAVIATVSATAPNALSDSISSISQQSLQDGPAFCHGHECPPFSVQNTTSRYQLRNYSAGEVPCGWRSFAHPYHPCTSRLALRPQLVRHAHITPFLIDCLHRPLRAIADTFDTFKLSGS